MPTRSPTCRRAPSAGSIRVVRRRRRRHLIQFVVVLGVIALVAVLLRTSVVEPFSVTSTSMMPTLRAGTDVLVVKSSFLTGAVEPG